MVSIGHGGTEKIYLDDFKGKSHRNKWMRTREVSLFSETSIWMFNGLVFSGTFTGKPVEILWFPVKIFPPIHSEVVISGIH